MTERPRNLAPGFVRAAGLLALLAGVLVMHVFVAAPSPAYPAGHAAAQFITSMGTSHSGTAVDHAAMRPAAHRGPVAPADGAARVMSATGHLPDRAIAASIQQTPAHAGPGCDDGGMCMHGGMHACVFILTALALLLGLTLLGRITGGPLDFARPAPLWLSRRARPPPWTMASLAELSILRV